MSSSNKTEKLELNWWSGSDTPTRADFLSDNYILDTVVGNHVNNTMYHLTNDQRTYLSEPIHIELVQGSGEDSRTVTLDFQPTLAFCFPINSPMSVTEDGTVTSYSAAAAYELGTSGGMYILENAVSFYNETISGNVYALNNSDIQYVLAAFR